MLHTIANYIKRLFTGQEQLSVAHEEPYLVKKINTARFLSVHKAEHSLLTVPTMFPSIVAYIFILRKTTVALSSDIRIFGPDITRDIVDVNINRFFLDLQGDYINEQTNADEFFLSANEFLTTYERISNALSENPVTHQNLTAVVRLASNVKRLVGHLNAISDLL